MADSQAEQERRRGEIRAAMRVMDSPLGLALAVDPEDSYLLSDAVRCYINAADAGTIFCVHASCERDLASMLAASGSAPAAAHRWGLGALVTYCASQGLMPPEILGELRELNDHRKTLYHYGHSESDTALRQRTLELIQEIGHSELSAEFEEKHGYGGENKEIFAFAMDRVLQRNALSALTTGFRLRSWLAQSLR
ncbi:hypothetical protein [Catellatospora sp. NPDC049133]|uniref:hypothetical protein n=1 Tax=Catellatospora sp. NPDC049133 TaxID=3155499 RepID=UPI0033C6D034